MLDIKSLRDAVKDLAQSLQIATIFPAALIVTINIYIIAPLFFPNIRNESSTSLTLVISLTLLISYTFYAFNYPLVRLFEGYKFRNGDLFPWLWEIREKSFNRLQDELEALENEIDRLKNSPNEHFKEVKIEHLHTKYSRLASEFEMHFPSDIELVLPTRFGNTVAAFEDYPRTRYGMDSIAIWPRLVPVLKDKEYLAYVNQEKTVVDFLLNTCVTTSIAGLELFYYFLYFGKWLESIIILLTALCVALILYEGMVRAAAEWGATIRVAFDLFRDDLHYALGLERKQTFEAEFAQWNSVSAFFLQRREGNWSDFTEFIAADKRIERVVK